MLSFLQIYLYGVLLSGVISCILFSYDAYIQYFLEKVNEARNNMSEEERFQLDNINKDAIITYQIFITSMFSWIGLIYIVVDILLFFSSKN